MRKCAPVRLCAPAVAALVALPVGAQSQSGLTLGEVVVTATRVEQSLANLLADVMVIEADVIARSAAVSLADVLVHLPGIEMVRNGGPLGTTSLFFRMGNTNHTVVLIDGIRLDTQNGRGGVSQPDQQIDCPWCCRCLYQPKFLSYPVAGMSCCEKFEGIRAG